jgi:serine/threonine protein kinase
MGTPKKKDVLFICYSHTDQSYKQRFDKFLKVGALQDRVEIFSDADIAPGDEWQERIADGLRKATASLLLVSQDFMVSPFIQQVELRELLTAQVRRGLRLFLVPVRSTYHEGTYLERFQWARPPNKPLSGLTEPEQEQAMVEICLQISNRLSTPADDSTINQTIKSLESIPKLNLPSIYELEGVLGEGKFARCYLAKDRLLERKVVLKVLREDLSRESPAYDRYVRSSSRLKHRNIQGLLFSQADKLPHFIVTPHIDGPTLRQRLDEPDPDKHLTFKEAIDCTIQLARTLAYAHDHQCIHDRLRPSEIRFDRDHQPVLQNFRTLDSARQALADERGDLDRTGMGSLHEGPATLEDVQYASPEARRGAPADARSDQYLLGLVAFEMITGSPPVRLTSWASLLDPEVAAILNAPPALKEVTRACSARISDAIAKMLAADPTERWANCAEIADALEEAVSDACWLVAKDSYRRCAQKPEFYQTVYQNLFRAMPEIERMFPPSLDRQYALLRDSIWLLLTYPQTRDHEEPTILSGIARTHTHLTPAHFDKFNEAILSAVAQHDAPTLRQSWHEAMKPGFDYLKGRLTITPTAARTTSTTAATAPPAPAAPVARAPDLRTGAAAPATAPPAPTTPAARAATATPPAAARAPSRRNRAPAAPAPAVVTAGPTARRSLRPANGKPAGRSSG